jgi:hypothetical protein
LVATLLISSCNSQDLDTPYYLLNKGWKLKLGDSLEWAKSNYNDSKWREFDLSNLSRNDTFKRYDGYAWYRVKFFIPSSLKKVAYSPDNFKIFLGPVDDCDQVYLNGAIIGENTIAVDPNYKPDSNFKKAKGLWNADRKYILSVKDKRVLWDKVNTLCIRVYDGWGEGGLVSTVPGFGMCRLQDSVFIDTKNFYKAGKDGFLQREIIIKNTLKSTLKSDFLVTALNQETKRSVYKLSLPVDLNPGESKTIPIILPINTDQTEVTFKLKDKVSDFIVTQTEIIPYVLADIKF